MCYRNGYGCSYCGHESEIKTTPDYIRIDRNGLSEKELFEALDVLERICDALADREGYYLSDEEYDEPVFMVAYTPGEPMNIITEDEADDYLPCYGVDDVIEQAPGTALVMSYDPRLLFSVGNQKYLEGTFLIYAVDDEGDTISLEADDIYRIQKVIRDRTICVTQGDDEMPVFSMN